MVPKGATGFALWEQQLSIQGRLLSLVGPANINSVTFWYWGRGAWEVLHMSTQHIAGRTL
jgi:hypothetical protein